MKLHLFLIAAITLISCQKQRESVTSCELIDIGAVGSQCESLYSIGEHGKAAQLFFKTGEQNQSSELFVYAAWQFGEAGNADSALIAVKRAVEFGMNNPYVLDKVGIEDDHKNSSLRKEVDQLLEHIKNKNSSIDNFEIITTPVVNFWSYFDRALKDTINARKYLSEFVCEGSDAIKDYYHIRYENVDNMYQTMIVKNPEYYTYVKNFVTPEKLEKVSDDSRNMMLKFSKIYPNAVFPKTYIVPDLINSSGTLTELGLYIGVCMFAKSDTMPLKNLNNWQKTHISEFEDMKYHLVHELMHFQQSYSDFKNRDLLLGKLIEEGACDFLVTLLAGNEMSTNMRRNIEYVHENIRFILDELKRDIYGKDLSKWMYNGGAIKDRPNDLGYSVGYLICKSYYQNSHDKEKAIFELLNTNDFKTIIEESEFKEIL